MAKYIAVIDDSLTVRKLLEVTLGRAGYSVATWASAGEALLALFSPCESHPDLLLVDIGLPQMDGIDVIKQVRANKQYAQIPILVISGRDGVLDRLKARLAGANGYVTKPFKTEEVVALVQRYLC